MTQFNFKKLTAGLAVFLFATALFGSPAFAAKGDQGVDNSVYQGMYGKFGYGSDKFMISQIGGYYGGYGYIDQTTYRTQIQSAIAQGKRAHDYIFIQDVTTRAEMKAVIDHYMALSQTPKDAIFALDVESGATNTDVIMYGLEYIKSLGKTPMLYGYLNYLTAHLDLQSISEKFPLWLAEYPNYEVTPKPNFNYFPSFNNVQVFQFSSTYIAGGLDGNVDLTGITDNGYKNGDADKPKTETPAINDGQVADDTAKKTIKPGMTVKVNFGANKYATGETIPQFVKGVPHKVLAVDGKKVLLADINSWLDRSDVEILDANKSAIDQFKQAGNKFTAYGSFKVDKIAFVNGIWQAINYDLAGGKNADWTANGIPLAILDNVTRGNVAPTRVGDTVKFMNGYNYGTIDKYDTPSNGAGIVEGNFGNVWYDANGLLTK